MTSRNVRLGCFCTLALAGLVLTAGCAHRQWVDSAGITRWSGMNLSLTLPAGSWEVEEVSPGSVVQFRRTGSSAHLVCMRIEAEKGDSGDLALRRLFVHFREKRLIRRWPHTLPDGTTAMCGEYAVTEEGREIRVRAYVVLKGQWLYELIAWGLDESTIEAVADSLTFVESAP